MGFWEINWKKGVLHITFKQPHEDIEISFISIKKFKKSAFPKPHRNAASMRVDKEDCQLGSSRGGMTTKILLL